MGWVSLTSSHCSPALSSIISYYPGCPFWQWLPMSSLVERRRPVRSLSWECVWTCQQAPCLCSLASDPSSAPWIFPCAADSGKCPRTNSSLRHPTLDIIGSLLRPSTSRMRWSGSDDEQYTCSSHGWDSYMHRSNHFHGLDPLSSIIDFYLNYSLTCLMKCAIRVL